MRAIDTNNKNNHGNKRCYCAALVAATTVLSACVTQPTYKKNEQPTIVMNTNGVPNFYKVERGDTVSKIASRYGISWREVAKLNRLDSSNTIYTGQWLALWKSTTEPAEPAKPKQDVLPAVQAKAPPPPPPPTSRLEHNTPSAPMAGSHSTLVGSVGLMQFIYPVGKKSKIVRHFGEVRQANGISARAEGMWFDGSVGDEVVASRAGTVIYADGNNMQNASISIRHADGFTSEYRFIKDAAVQQGQNVVAGQRIASMKQNNGVVVMEFRIQKGSAYIDPESVLR